MVHIKDSESGEELDDVPFLKKDGGLECMMGENYVQNRGSNWKCCCISIRMCSKVSLENQSHQALHTHC